MDRKQLVGVALLAVTMAGCQSMTSQKTTGKKKNSMNPFASWFEKEYQEPRRMAAMWSADVATLPGQGNVRGAGARIYFYNEKSQAIPVDGEIIVHGFAEPVERSGEKSTVADRKFTFTSEQITQQYSESDLGASYSIWIPWDAAGGWQQEITLIPTFKSKSGQIVQGDAAKVLLPGRATPASETPAASAIQQVAAFQPSSQYQTQPNVFGQMISGPDGTQAINGNSGLKTTTIQLPSDVSRRMMQTNRAATPPQMQPSQPSAPRPEVLPRQAPMQNYPPQNQLPPPQDWQANAAYQQAMQQQMAMLNGTAAGLMQPQGLMPQGMTPPPGTYTETLNGNVTTVHNGLPGQSIPASLQGANPQGANSASQNNSYGLPQTVRTSTTASGLNTIPVRQPAYVPQQPFNGGTFR